MLGEPRLRPIHHGLEGGDRDSPCSYLGRRKVKFWKDSAIIFYAFSNPGVQFWKGKFGGLMNIFRRFFVVIGQFALNGSDESTSSSCLEEAI